MLAKLFTKMYKMIGVRLPKIQMGWHELMDYLQAVEIVLFPFTGQCNTV